MADISRKEVEHLAHLSRLAFDKDDLRRFSRDMAAIVKFIAVLKRADAAEIEPKIGGTDMRNVLRHDEADLDHRALAADDAGRIIGAFPESSKGRLKVPKVL